MAAGFGVLAAGTRPLPRPRPLPRLRTSTYMPTLPLWYHGYMPEQQTPTFQLIADNRSLSAAVQELCSYSVIAVDTEFMREKTYQAQLCLLQLASSDRGYIIDPLTGIDLKILTELFYDSNIVKVFHAGYQDMEILFHLLGQPPTPVFDTQIAASMLGQPQQISLAALIKSYLGIELYKGDTFSDWSKRPLRDTQLNYAFDDVRYLPQIYTTMHDRLVSSGRLSWLNDEFNALSSPGRYLETPEKLWQRLKGHNNLNRRQLGVLQQTAIWRDNTARRRDLPRKWVVTDEQLIDIARRSPTTLDELYQTRGIREKISVVSARELLAAVQSGLTMPEGDLPERPRKPANANEATAAIDLMQALVHLRATEQHIPASVLASADDLRALASGHTSGLSILRGWRRELIGNELLDLLAGDLVLSLDQGRLLIEKKR